jgi:putative transport protein
MNLLISESHLALFLIIAVGILIGNLSFKGISLDVSAVVFVALALGHFGVVVPREFQTIGLLLFIFTIGLQAGPGFFDSFRKHGRQLVILGLIIVTAGALTAGLLSWWWKVDFKIAVGLFTGALTSTPGLAAAIEASQSPLASIGYGIAYPFGVIGVILFVRLLPRWLGVDLAKVQKDYDRDTRADFPDIFNQTFIVENPNIDGHTIGELGIGRMTQTRISRVQKNGITTTPTAQTVLKLGDRLKAVGTKDALEKARILIGSVTQEDIPLSQGYEVQWVLVTNKEVVSKSLGQLNLFGYYNATVTRIRRAGIDITPSAQSVLRFGDKLMIACDHENMARVTCLLGNDTKRLSETDFLPIALGIIIGILAGKLTLPLPGGFNFSLGMTGGVLAAALILSRIGKTGPVIWTMSGMANTLLRELGLLFFLAAVGTEAGAHLARTISEHGWLLFGIGAATTLVPMLVAVLVGQFLLKMNFLILLGGITGGMTSTPGLAAVTPMTESNAPSVAYATVYPIAMVGMIIAAQILSRI